MRRALVAASLLLASCSSDPETEQRSAVEHGRDLFASTSTSEAKNNVFACATCHRTTPGADDRILPGADLAGAVARPSFWGGKNLDLLRAVNDCRYYFMGAQRAWTDQDADARGMYAFLESLPPAKTDAVAFTVVPSAVDLPAGDPSRGRVVYDKACASCHGAASSGAGKLRGNIPTLPGESVAYFATLGFDRTATRITFVEKVRHGPFLGLYGQMPLFSTEALSDADLGALLAFLALY